MQVLRDPQLRHFGLRSRMALDRSDTRWQNLEGAWQRLIWAREAAGYATGAAFAKKIKEKQHTYKAYERDPLSASKHTPLDFAKARAWAPDLGVRWEWLLEGEGVPWDDGDDAPPAKAQRLVAGAPPKDQEKIVQMIELMLKQVG